MTNTTIKGHTPTHKETERYLTTPLPVKSVRNNEKKIEKK